MARVHRTLSLRSAFNADNFGAGSGGPGNLEKLMRAIHPTASLVPDRRVMVDGMMVEARHVQTTKNYHLVHLSACTPDDEISIVPNAGPVPEADLGRAEAPENSEFLDGEMMALFRSNDVILCKCGMPERVFVEYIRALAEVKGIPRSVTTFVMGKRIDVDKLAMIASEGVKSVSMGAVAHSASVDHAERSTVRHQLVGSVIDELRAILGIGEEIPQEAENLKVVVTLSFDKRSGTALAQEQIQKLAETVVNDEDEGFVIETLSNRKIRANDVLLSKPIQVEPFAKSVSYNDVWGELIAFDK